MVPMQGVRLADNVAPKNPGEYALMDSGYWWVMTPNEIFASVDPTLYTVEVHEDKTVTIRPSLLLHGYHGWLTRGEWT